MSFNPSLSAVDAAFASQGIGLYPGQDPWQTATHILPQGTLLAHLDWRAEARIRAREAAVSEFFTDIDTLTQCYDPVNGHSPRLLAELVQVGPRRRRRDIGEHFYNPNIVIYELQRDLQPDEYTEAPVERNHHYGPGQGKQYFINIDKEELVQQGILALKDLHTCKDCNHRLEWLMAMEASNASNDAIGDAIFKVCAEYSSRLTAGEDWPDIAVSRALLVASI